MVFCAASFSSQHPTGRKLDLSWYWMFMGGGRRADSFERMRLRGLTGARDEFHVAATVQNLKTLVSRSWCPPPNEPLTCVA
jgi:hypothetical protein